MSDESIGLPDPVKLRLLADWFEKEEGTLRWGDDCDTSVHDDLRLWTKNISILKRKLSRLLSVVNGCSINGLRTQVKNLIIRIFL